MSENNKEDNPEIIESVIIESPELSDEVVENAPIVVKKGSFLSFVAFLLAASALTVSAYLYIQMKKNDLKDDDIDWQAQIQSVEIKSEQKFKQLASQVKQMQKTNGELQEQLNNIESIAANIQPSDNSGTIEKYDDTQLINKLQTMDVQLVSQEKALNQIQTTVENNTKKQNQAIQQLIQKLDKQEPQTNNSMRIDQNYFYEVAEYFLQAAHKHLNINGNVEKGHEFMNKAIEQLNTLDGVEYQQLAQKIQKVSGELLKNPPVDIPTINKQIDQLSSLSAQLSFDNSIKAESSNQEESSWYDKLIVIRKVDDKSEVKLTSAEKEKVFQDIENHFSMMKIALMSNKQILWVEEITALESSLAEHFASQSSDIKEQLNELKALDVNPKLPDLSEYLESIQALNNTKFKQVGIPFETK